MSSKSVVLLWIYCNFSNFQNGRCRNLVFFEIVKFYWLLRLRGSRRISIPNFNQIGQSVAEILRFFHLSRWRRPPSRIVEFTKFNWLTVAIWPRRITSPNFVKIGRSIAEMLQFSYFQDDHCRHLGFLKSRNFIGYSGGEGSDASACQIFSKSVNRSQTYYDFSIFQDGGLGLSNSQNFIGCRCLEVPYASLYQVSSKSVVPLQRYCDFSNFKISRRRHLGF